MVDKKQDPDYCQKDLLGQHCWKHLGIYATEKNVYEVMRCVNCKKCLRRKIEFIKEGKK